MKYVLLFGSADVGLESLPEERRTALYGEIAQWWGRHAQAGSILGGARLQGAGTATTVRRDGEPVVTDGPFVEAKEVLGGYGLIEVANLDEAIALAKTWPALQLDGESVEIRPIVER